MNTPHALRVALLAESKQLGGFRALLENQGLSITADACLSQSETRWSPGNADVVLVGLGDSFDKQQLEHLLDDSRIPVLLNQGGVGSTQLWREGLVGKLYALAGKSRAEHPARVRSGRPDLHLVSAQPDADRLEHTVVVLGGSIGGPRAITRFLQHLPNNLPVSFLVAQHISAEYQHLLVSQLDRCSNWGVTPLQAEQKLRPGQVLLVPPEQKISATADGMVRQHAQAWESAHRPSISAVLEVAAQAFGAQSGAILFSGLGSDGSRGCELIEQYGGFVWTQSRESCINPKLPHAAQRRCSIDFSGTPEELASALCRRYQADSASLN